MKVYIVRDSDFTMSQGMPASNLLNYEEFGQRYTSVFDEVVLVGRLFDKEDITAKPVVGHKVTFLGIPGYHGPLGFAKNLLSILKFIFSNTPSDAAYILRIPATIPMFYSFVLRAKRVKFAVEVAADPHDGYSAKALGNHPLAPLFRKLFVGVTRWQCKVAAASCYVTRSALQKRYPPGRVQTSFSFTSINLTPECFVDAPRTDFDIAKPHLVMTGNMQKTLKGHDLFLQTLARLRAEGIAATATIIGYGENLSTFQNLALDLGLDECVTFTGKLPAGKPVREVLDTADLFVLPSRQEGLPRALLEAMARGVPAVASRVGGTPELLADESLIEVDDLGALVATVKHHLSSKKLLIQHSTRNLEVANDYKGDIINRRRTEFFHTVKRISEIKE